MDKKLQQGMDWLTKEMKKDEKEIQIHKMKMIDEIKKINPKVVVFPKGNEVKGDYVYVNVTHCTSGTLLGELC